MTITISRTPTLKQVGDLVINWIYLLATQYMGETNEFRLSLTC